MNDNNELAEATISYMNTMPPLPHQTTTHQTHNTVSPASRHEGQQHYHRTSHHQYHNQQQQYHPYARPTNTPYNQHSQESYGYEGYYNANNKMSSYPSMPPRQQHQQVSPHEGDEVQYVGHNSQSSQYPATPSTQHQSNSMMMQRQPPTIITTTKPPSLPSPKSSSSKSKKSTTNKNSKVKKPPRSYTEYNIFFQLERERILGNLIEEQEEKKKKNGKESGVEETGDGSGEEGDVEGDDAKSDIKDVEDKVAQDTKNDTNKEEEDEEDKPYPTIDSKGRQLNKPSDTNDILPRPPRFAHLQLSPLWYDSTHRLAESKRNKAKRKHRKTHGLVGFLELTKMIAKEWKVVDTTTKSYCKRVANRQLVLYKEEMKVVKKKQQMEEQQLSLNNVGGEDNASGNSGGKSKKKQKKDERTPMQLQQMLRIQYCNRPSRSRQQQHYSPQSSDLPPLTPDSQFPMNDHHHHSHGVSSSGNGNLLTPLDELNRRRALYGAQAAAIEAKTKFRSPGTSRMERAMGSRSGNRALISGKIQQGKVSSASYLSPADGCIDNQHAAMSAVTPSPSRGRQGLLVGTSPDVSATSTDKLAVASAPNEGSMTPSQLPMKKRRKKLLEENSEEDIDSDIKKNNKDTATATTKPALPVRHSSVNSVGFLSSPGFGFQLSPSMGMMTPGGNGGFGSPTQYHKTLVGPYLNDNEVKSSPFPYIDWSPQDSSPQDNTKEQQGKPSLARDHSRGIVPPHLGVPGGYHHHGRHPGTMLGPHSSGMSPGIGFADEGVLDLDEEEMKLMWSKMATTAKRKRVTSRDQAAAWMYGQYGHGSYGGVGMGSFAASPGGGGLMSWAHSFSSPGNVGGRPDILSRGMSNGSVMKKEETVTASVESNGEEKEEAEKKTELPSLTEV